MPTTTAFTLNTNNTLKVGDYSVTGGTITLTGAGATAEITPANGIKVTGAAAAALTFTGAIATPALHIAGTAALNTAAAGTSIVSIKASGTASAPVTTVSVIGDNTSDLTAGTIVLGNSATDTTYVFTGSAVPGTPAHSGTPPTAYPFVTLANAVSTIPADTTATLNGIATLTGLTVGGLLDVKAVTTLGAITLSGTLELPAEAIVVTTGTVTGGTIHVAGTNGGNFRSQGGAATGGTGTIQQNAGKLANAKATLSPVPTLTISTGTAQAFVSSDWTGITYSPAVDSSGLTGTGSLGTGAIALAVSGDGLGATWTAGSSNFSSTVGGTIRVADHVATIANLALDIPGFTASATGSWS